MFGSGVILSAHRFLSGPPRGAGRGRRGPSRLVGAVIGVALSMIPLVVVQQVADGMIAGIAERFIEAGSYHLRAVARSPQDDEAVRRLADRTEQIDGVLSAVPERQGFGLLYSEEGRSGVNIRAVPHRWWSEDPRVRELVTVTAGRFDLTAESNVVIGTVVASRLGVGVGDTVRLLTVRPVGEGQVLPRVSRFQVAGVMSTGYRDLDRLWVFIPRARGVRVIPDETATEIVGIKVAAPRALPNPLFLRGLRAIAERGARARMLDLTERVVTQFDAGWFIYDWYSAERSRYVSFLTSRNLLAAVMAMIVLVAVVNISSALVLLVVEKEQDIAIMRATGVSASRVAAVFVVAGLVIGVLGAVVGLVTGLLLSLHINEILRAVETVVTAGTGRTLDIFNPEFYLQSIPIELQPVPALGSVFLVLLLSLAAGALPARRAASIPPERILRGRPGWSGRGDVVH